MNAYSTVYGSPIQNAQSFVKDPVAHSTALAKPILGLGGKKNRTKRKMKKLNKKATHKRQR
jgi:hypothetical protein